MNDTTDVKIGLQQIKQESPDELTLGYLNFNSLWNKFDTFDTLTYIIGNNIDIPLISETKINYFI